MAWPGRIRPGTTIDAPAINLDVAPTILGLAGLPVPAGFQGFDWRPCCAGGPPPRERVLWFQAHKGAVLSSQEARTPAARGCWRSGLMAGRPQGDLPWRREAPALRSRGDPGEPNLAGDSQLRSGSGTG